MKWLSLFSSKVAAYYLFLSMLAGGVLSYVLFAQECDAKSRHTASITSPNSQPASCSYEIGRLSGYKYIRPLLFAEQKCESQKMAPIKDGVNNLIAEYKKEGMLTSASVYLRDLKHEDWMAINEQEKYDPGSLMKLPLMITFIRMAEEKQGLLNMEVFYDKPFPSQKVPLFKAPTIKPGTKYTIKQLLQHTIINSDNDAAALLSQYLDVPTFTRLFADLGLPPVDVRNSTYPMNVKECSTFIEALFNASYLTIDDSEFATALLTESNFKLGIVNQLPKDVKVAHKFGEAGDEKTAELSETGIIYLGDNPYLITIMTKGPVMKNLPQTLRGISKLVYDKMAQHN